MRNFLITIEGKQYEVSVEEVSSDGKVTPVVTAAAPVVSAAPAAKAPVNGTEMKCTMPGLIVNFKVAEGATVKKGDVVVVLEAMKMENEIVAPVSGTISQVVVSSGNTVDTDQTLAFIG